MKFELFRKNGKFFSLMLILGFIGVLFSFEAVYSAAFTSIQSGNFDDGATWGHDSPGVKGTDWPGNATDSFTISFGTVVTYNVSESNGLNTSNIYGTLTFSTSDDTLLTLGTNQYIYVRTEGNLQVGSASSPIPYTHTAAIKGGSAGHIFVEDNGKFYVYGDPAYYGGVISATLADNAENADGDTTITTNEDMSSTWLAGNELIVSYSGFVNPASSPNTASYSKYFNIQSLSGYNITSDDDTITADAGVGSIYKAYAVNLSRNVYIGMTSPTLTVGSYSYSGNFLITDYNSSVKSLYFKDMTFAGISSFIESTSIGPALFENVVFRNNHTSASIAKTTASNLIFKNSVFFSNGNGLVGSGYSGNSWNNTLIDGCYFISNTTAFNSIGNNCTIDNTKFICNSSVFSAIFAANFRITNFEISQSDYIFNFSSPTQSSNILLENGFIQSTYSSPFYPDISDLMVKDVYVYKIHSSSYYISITAKLNWKFYNVCFGYNPAKTEVSSGISYEINVGADVENLKEIYFYNCKFPSIGCRIYGSTNYGASPYYIYMENYNQTDTQKVYSNNYITSKIVADGSGANPTALPPGNTSIIKVENSATPNTSSKANKIVSQRWWKAAGTYHPKFTIQHNFTSAIPENQLFLRVLYLDSNSTYNVAMEEDFNAVATRTSTTDWSQSKTVEIITGRDGWVDLEIWFLGYEGSKDVFIAASPSW